MTISSSFTRLMLLGRQQHQQEPQEQRGNGDVRRRSTKTGKLIAESSNRVYAGDEDQSLPQPLLQEQSPKDRKQTTSYGGCPYHHADDPQQRWNDDEKKESMIENEEYVTVSMSLLPRIITVHLPKCALLSLRHDGEQQEEQKDNNNNEEEDRHRQLRFWKEYAWQQCKEEVFEAIVLTCRDKDCHHHTDHTTITTKSSSTLSSSCSSMTKPIEKTATRIISTKENDRDAGDGASPLLPTSLMVGNSDDEKSSSSSSSSTSSISTSSSPSGGVTATETTTSAAVITTTSSAYTDDTMLQKRLEVLNRVAQVQRQYLEAKGPKVVYGELLQGILDLMNCEYGFISEVKYEPETGAMYLHSHATTTNSSDPMTRQYFQNYAAGLKFYRLDTLFGLAITTKQPIISNDPTDDPRKIRGCPYGHPPLRNFLGVPFFHKNSDAMGMIAIANKHGNDFTHHDVDFLQPFTLTAANLVQAYLQIEANEHLIDTLEMRVKERTKKLEQCIDDLALANVRVMEASAAQLRHFACMSHEIRTPLNCIIGLSSLLLENSYLDTPSSTSSSTITTTTTATATQASETLMIPSNESNENHHPNNDNRLSPYQQESMQMIVSSGDLLLTVVNDVLDYSKLQTGNVEIEVQTANLQETLNGIVHSIEMKGASKNISVRTMYDSSVPSFITTDSRRLQQILYNLLGNSLKFSPDGGVIELKVQLLQTSKVDMEENDIDDKALVMKPSSDTIRSINHNSDHKPTPRPWLEREESFDSVEEAREFKTSIILLNDSDRDVNHDSQQDIACAESQAAHEELLSPKKSSIAKKLSAAKERHSQKHNQTNIPYDENIKLSLRPRSCNDLVALSLEVDEGKDPRAKYHRIDSLNLTNRVPNNNTTIQDGDHPVVSSTGANDIILRLQVKDYGVGIAKNDFDRIFEPFSQATAETERVFGGTGLGLAITSRLVQALGGSISVDSEVGYWTEFTIELPFRNEPCDISHLIHDQLVHEKNVRTIYVVDSNENTREYMTRLLKPYQYNHRYKKGKQLSLEFFMTLQGLVTHTEERKEQERDGYGICLIQEDAYHRGLFQSLNEISNHRMMLTTFGSKFIVNETKCHFRKLDQVLPSVLFETLASSIPKRSSSSNTDMTPHHHHKRAHRYSNPMTSTTDCDNIQKIKLLIAEDNQINQRVLCRILERMSIQNVDIANDGKQAVDMEKANVYDLILMDMQMPYMDGVEATKRILTSYNVPNEDSANDTMKSTRMKTAEEAAMMPILRHNPPPKIVFVTAHAEPYYEQECINAGAVGFITKPYSVQDIETLMHRLFVEKQ